MTLECIRKKVANEFPYSDLTEIIGDGIVDFIYNELTKPKTCETCKYFDDEERGNGIGTCENKKPQSPWGTVSSFGCIYHEPKVL